MAGHNRKTPPPKLNRRHSEQVIERIKLAQLVNRVQDFALGELDPKTKKPIVMSDAQLRGAMGLINKRLANAEGVRRHEHSGEVTLRQLIEQAAGKAPPLAVEPGDLDPDDEGDDVG